MCLSAGGKGAYTAIDAVGGEMTKQLSLALQDGGTVYVYGALSGDPIQMDTLDTLYKYKRVEVRAYLSCRHPLPALASYFLQSVRVYSLKVQIDYSHIGHGRHACIP